ncbi:MAG: hypothetical protein MJZ16_00190 [Bacteroidales bacterium]|nr:hypothetical protein [Bacteroidales bacterium]
MTEQEKREFLVQNLLDIYRRCNMSASRCEKPSLSFFDKLKGKTIPSYYPDIVINNYHGTKGLTAYYIVLPKGTSVGNIDMKQLPDYMRSSYVKIIYGSVFCLEEQEPERYKKGCHFAAQYKSQAVNPIQVNNPLPRVCNDQELASLYAQAWQNLDARLLKDYLDKDFHYSNDSVFDDMASRDEYLDYLVEKFNVLRRTQSIKRVQLGRNGATGGWAVLIKQIQNDGMPIVCGFFIESKNGRILSVEVHEMDLPNF